VSTEKYFSVGIAPQTASKPSFAPPARAALISGIVGKSSEI